MYHLMSALIVKHYKVIGYGANEGLFNFTI